MKVFGLTLKEYLDPVKYYVLAALLIVVSQYYVGVPLSDQYPFLLNLTQGLWAAMVALSVLTLVRKYKNFGVGNVLFTGVLFSLIIHGVKAFFFRVFLFPYSGTFEMVVEKIIYKFLYGSFLAMVVATVLGIVFIYLKKEKVLK